MKVRWTDKALENLCIVPTLCVGMPPATLQRRRYRTAGAVKSAFPRGSARRYTQVLEARLFGRDAEIQRPGMATLMHNRCP